MMGAANHKANARQYPFLDKLVSANVRPTDASLVPFKPYMIVEARGKRLGDRPVRVGFLGLSQLVPPPFKQGDKTHEFATSKKYTVGSPLEAAKRFVPELRKQVDLLVVLAYMPVAEAQKIGLGVAGVDAIIAANLIPQSSPVAEAGDAILVNVHQQTKYLSELRLYTDPAKPGALVNYNHRHVKLDGAIPDDPAAKANYDAAHAELVKASGGNTHTHKH
jgi:2',3'-cyclic-nucleotide 2'-phosphodiesterase (5'-nucleotidase family)